MLDFIYVETEFHIMLVENDEVIDSDSEYIYDYTYFWQLVAVQ